MKKATTKRIFSSFIALVMFISTLAGTFTLSFVTLFADDIPVNTVDSFAWNFSDQIVGDVIGQVIEAETQNVRGQSTAVVSYRNVVSRAFTALHSAGTALTGNEGANQILVDNQSSKWCNTGVTLANAWFILDAGSPIKAQAYAIRGANDDASYDGRYLHTWTVEGSNNPAGPWTTVSAPGAQGPGWAGNYHLRMFDFNATAIPDEGFQYYRLAIQRRGVSAAGTALSTSGTTMQFSYFGLVTSYETVTVGFDGEGPFLFPLVAAGTFANWAGNRPTMNGANVIRVNGNVAGTGTAPIQASSYTTIKSGLNILVHPDTRFGYMFAPEGVSTTLGTNTYDYQYHGAHMAIDLKFSDGTRLKDLKAIDQYGIGMHPIDQGKGKVHKTYQWNYVETQLGKVAAGKVITDIILGAEMPDARPGHKFSGSFDDIKIFRCPQGLDYSKVDLADFVDIRQGANASGNVTAAITPSVALPFSHQYWAPSTERASSNKYQWHHTSLHGFSTSHLASRHMGEQLTYLIQANSTTTSTTNTNVNNAVNNSGVRYLHDKEFAYSNYHYGVTYEERNTDGSLTSAPGVTVELTPTEYGAVFRFTFPAGSAARNIMFASPMGDASADGRSMMSGAAGNQSFSAWIQGYSDTSTQNTGRAFRRKHMYGEFDTPPSGFYIPTTGANANIRSMARFPDLANGPNGSTVIEMRVATSWMSQDQAKKNFAIDLIGRGKDEPVGTWTPAQGKWFDAIKEESKQKWNEVLGTVQFEDPTANFWQYQNFYSKLSRSILFPTTLSEYTGNGNEGGYQYASPYRGTTANPIIMDGHFIYNEGWWDTFKSKWPLIGFLLPERGAPLVDGIIQHYIDQNGLGTAAGASTSAVSNAHAVPRWINPAGNNLMTGTSSDAVISDLYATYDVAFNKVFEGYQSWLKSSAVVSPQTNMGGRTGIHQSMFRGYHAWGTSTAAGGGGQLDTTWSLEGYINDAAQVHMLRKMIEEIDEEDMLQGKSGAYWKQRWADEVVYYESRAKGFVHHFDFSQPANYTGNAGLGSQTISFTPGWMRNKNSAGQWLGGNGSTTAAFNPLHWGWGFCEDNAWPYRFLAPQDGRGLANLMGIAQNRPGPEALRIALDEGFNAEGVYMNYEGGGYGSWIHEGYEKRETKTGQFGISNQPAYHMPWMYNHSDQPSKAQYWTRTTLARMYSGEHIGHGYMGEEDNGASASWYVWAALGLYPLDLGSGELIISSPAFRKTTITNDNGKKVTINAPNNSFENIYIQSMKVNGQDYRKLSLSADLLKKDLVIDYVMGPEPNDAWWNEGPSSLTKDDEAPEILTSLTPTDIAIVTTTIPADHATPVVSVSGIAADNAASLFNKNAGNTTTADEATFTGTTASITYYNPLAPKVEMYTMTSGWNANASSPRAWTFSGSNDGAEWVLLDQRADEDFFGWRKYTRPFAIPAAKQGNYKYYKLDITAASGTNALRLSQMELLADQHALSNFVSLQIEIDAAQAILDSDVKYGKGTVDALEAVLKDARDMITEAKASNREIAAMITSIRSAVAGLVRIRHITELNVATEFNESSAAGAEVTGGIPNTNGGAPNSWIAYQYIDFDSVDLLYDKVFLNYAADSSSCNAGSSIEVRIDAPDGELIALFDRNSNLRGGAAHPTGNWQTAGNWTTYREIEAQVLKQVEGIHHVYLVLRTGTGTPNQWVANIRNFSFDAAVPFVVDKTELGAAIESALLLEEEKYHPPTWPAFAAALANAISVNEDALVTQFAVDRALEALVAAREALRELFRVNFDYGILRDSESVIVIQGDKVAKPADPFEYGYTFNGWKLGSEYYDFDSPVTAHLDLEADWPLNEITSLRIDALSIMTVARYSEYNLNVILNEGAIDINVEWAIADPSLGYVDNDGNLHIFDKIGNVRLTAHDPLSGISHSITLRIAS